MGGEDHIPQISRSFTSSKSHPAGLDNKGLTRRLPNCLSGVMELMMFHCRGKFNDNGCLALA